MKSAGISTLCALLFVLAVGLTVRLIGIRHGEPDMIYHPDVSKQGIVAWAVCSGEIAFEPWHGTDFTLSMYPYGAPVLLGLFCRVLPDRFQTPPLTEANQNPLTRWTWALRLRFLGVFFFLTAAVCVLGALRRLMTPLALLVAGLLLVLEPYHAQYGHYGMNDVPVAAMLLLAWAAADRMRCERDRRPVFSLLTGLCLGLGFGMKYQGLLGLIFPAMAWFMSRKNRTATGRWLSVLAVGTGFAAGAVVTVPQLYEFRYFVTHIPDFLTWQSNITGESFSLAEKLHRNSALFLRYAIDSFLWLPALGALLAVGRALHHREDAGRRFLLLSAGLFCLFLLCVFVASRDFLRSNDLLVVSPFLILMYALLCPSPRSAGLASKLALGLGAVLVVFYGGVSFLDALALRRVDTRLRAQAWCQSEIPAGASVLRERYTLPIGRADLREWECRYLGDRHCAPTARAGGADFLVTSSLASARFYDRLSPYLDESYQAIYDELSQKYQLAAEFRDRELFFAHPTIRVYALE